MIKRKCLEETRASQVALVAKSLPANAGDLRDKVQPPGQEDPLEESSPLHYSCLEGPMDRGTWQATLYMVTKSQTWLKWLRTYARLWWDCCLFTRHGLGECIFWGEHSVHLSKWDNKVFTQTPLKGVLELIIWIWKEKPLDSISKWKSHSRDEANWENKETLCFFSWGGGKVFNLKHEVG